MTPASPAVRHVANLARTMAAVTLAWAPWPLAAAAPESPVPPAASGAAGVPMVPQFGAVPTANAGNGNDVTAQAPAGTISSATGSFDAVSGVTSESTTSGFGGAPVPNAYTLQLNTNPFASPLCGGGMNTCKGWEQFLYVSDGTQGTVAIRQWLLRVLGTCPAGWTPFTFNGSTDLHCWRDAASQAAGSAQPIANLAQLKLTGSVGAGGDTVTLALGTVTTSATSSSGIGADAGWTAAEFNVLGSGGNTSGGFQAVFNAGSTIVPRIAIGYGGTAAPTCVVQGFTGETNNLGFGPAPAPSGTGPALAFSLTTFGGLGPASCARATSIGDTHLMTQGGTFYDFQASGDFVLLERPEASFEVQARQVSGAPSWPNASINKAVAARLGKTRVAVCLPPVGLAVDGKRTALADGKTLRLADGAQVSRQGNVYLLRSAAGDSVRAEVVDPYINVTVGLGRWPDAVRGLLANHEDDPSEVAARDGAVLKAPFTEAGLYGHFADSWRVPGKDSMLAPCGKVRKEPPRPATTFFAKDLSGKAREKALAACRGAGVKDPTLLDACVLDVTVIGKASAAKVFATHRVPVVVGDATLRGRGKEGGKE